MRRATALALTIPSGILFGCWLLSASCLITGRGSFGGGGLAIEYICFGVLGLLSGFGLYAGLKALYAHSANGPCVRRADSSRPMRIIGKVLVGFGLLSLYTLAEIRAQTTSLGPAMFVVYGAVFCLALGGACLLAFRKPPQ